MSSFVNENSAICSSITGFNIKFIEYSLLRRYIERILIVLNIHLGAPSQRVQIGGYAAAASKPIPIVAAKPTLPSGFQVLQKGAAYEKTEPEPVKKPTFVARMITRWAEWDTDDENEEDRRYVDNSAWD